MKKYLPHIILLIATVAFVVAVYVKQANEQDRAIEAQPAAENFTSPIDVSPDNEYTFTSTEDGQTGLRLLIENVPVVYSEADFGVFVTQVNGVAAGEDNYWAIYHNGEYANVGVSELIVNQGDTLTIKLEEIE